MKKVLLASGLLMVAVVCAKAEMVTSSKEGGIIKSLPSIGQTVKKGDMLVTFSQSGINAEIDALKAKIEMAEEQLKNKTKDKERADKLGVKAIISHSEWEDASCDLIIAKLEIEGKKAEMKKLESDKSHCFIPAPYDCKVTKVLITENSGTDIGQKILEVQRLN